LPRPPKKLLPRKLLPLKKHLPLRLTKNNVRTAPLKTLAQPAGVFWFAGRRLLAS